VFIQGHLRFRGAAWSGELLDFDIILTPGDVFVFRLADVDGDGFWEIDQSIDPNNFAYTGMLKSCVPEGGAGVAKSNCMDQNNYLIPEPTNNDPAPRGAITQELIDHHRNLGYVEFIGEGILNGMTHARLDRLISPELAGRLATAGQRTAGNRLGTHLWSWVLSSGDVTGTTSNGTRLPDVDIGPFQDPLLGLNLATTPHTAGDVPNALSGTAFLTQAGQGYGLAYNAEALVNFRTNNPNNGHRIENYNVTVNMGAVYPPSALVPQIGVILHNENASARAADFSYVYGYGEAGGIQYGGDVSTNNPGPVGTNQQESRISFNNTWGPTLADGDDYTCASVSEWNDFANLRWTNDIPLNDGVCDDSRDNWDWTWGHPSSPNSIAEVEEAIRKPTVPNFPIPDGSSPRQLFTSFYFDGATFDKACEGNGRQDNPECSSTSLQSWYFGFFPTKFFYGEDANLWTTVAGSGCAGDIGCNVPPGSLLGRRGYLRAAVEHLITWGKPFNVGIWDIFENFPNSATCDTSPCTEQQQQSLSLREELAVFNIKNLKDTFGSGAFQNWREGRVSLQVWPTANVCNSINPHDCPTTYPALMYTFDWASDGTLTHWRPMER
jgi:hypothetical protein